jgi:hypothetical protein
MRYGLLPKPIQIMGVIIEYKGGRIAGVLFPCGAHQHVVISGIEQAVTVSLLVVTIEVTLVDSVAIAEAQKLSGVGIG